MFWLMWRMSISIRSFLQTHMPSNILLARISGWRTWGPLPIVSGAAAISFLAAANLATAALAAGGPQWLHVLVVIWIWNSMKFAWLGIVCRPPRKGRYGFGAPG